MLVSPFSLLICVSGINFFCSFLNRGVNSAFKRCSESAGSCNLMVVVEFQLCLLLYLDYLLDLKVIAGSINRF